MLLMIKIFIFICFLKCFIDGLDIWIEGFGKVVCGSIVYFKVIVKEKRVISLLVNW